MNACTQARDGREIAAEHDAQVLHWLARFGWLSARQVARLVWPAGSQGQRMAQRALRRLTDAGAVLRRPLPSGGVAYVIGQRGARQLRELGDEAVSGRGFRDLKFKAPVHRAIANDVAIDHLREPSLDVYTEAEIQRGVAPKLFLPHQGHERVPDLLVGQGGQYEWFEVEHAPKPRHRLDSLVALADNLLAPPAERRDSDQPARAPRCRRWRHPPVSFRMSVGRHGACLLAGFRALRA